MDVLFCMGRNHQPRGIFALGSILIRPEKGLQSIVGSSLIGAEGSCRHSLIRHRGDVRRGGLAGFSFLSL
jgi:hypothetical protein